jgi:large subunit ribosomal protein L22
VPDLDTRQTTARLRHVRISPSKVRQVLELIRGQDVETARETLRFCERGAARDVGKLLDSAVANAEHNDQIPEDELFVARAHADDGPTLKRWRPRARGRGVRIRKRTSHVTIVLARFGDEDLERRRQADAATPRGRRRVARRRPVERTEAVPAPDADADADEHDHDEHDHDHDEHGDDAADAAAPGRAPAKKATAKKTTKKATGAAPAKKSTKSAKRATPAKKAPAKRARKATKDDD